MAKKYITQERLKKNTLADIFTFILEKNTCNDNNKENNQCKK